MTTSTIRTLRRRQRRVRKVRKLKIKLAETQDKKERERLLNKLRRVTYYRNIPE